MVSEHPYTIRKSARARHMRLVVHCDGHVVLTAPHYMDDHRIKHFLDEKRDWIVKKIAAFKKLDLTLIHIPGHHDYHARKDEARAIVHERITRLGARLGVYPVRVNIKNQKTCWGSCSKQGTININYKIVYLPDTLQDYIIVHELCHLKELNHSQRFWKHVASVTENHRALRTELRKFRFTHP